jgi:soluble lytic murein transglycosylase-like protein
LKPTLKTLLAAFLCGLCAQAAAEIWGFVDENGVAHLASYQVDHRYYLFRKSPPRAEPEAPAAEAAVPAEPPNPASAALRRKYAPLVAAVAREFGLDAALLHAVIAVESAYNANARSHKGAVGLMQLMPGTAERYAVKNIWDPRENLRGGARYLRDLLALFNHDLALALAAYNAGEGAVAKAGNRIPPYAETLNYVPRVLAHYEYYRLRPPPAGASGS